MKIKISNYLLLAVLPCSIQEHKFERKTFKLLIGGSTASNACSMQGYKYDFRKGLVLIWERILF